MNRGKEKTPMRRRLEQGECWRRTLEEENIGQEKVGRKRRMFEIGLVTNP